MGIGVIPIWQPPGGLENDPESNFIVGFGMCDEFNVLIPRLNIP